jgi:uroporphyrinogen-III synthase
MTGFGLPLAGRRILLARRSAQAVTVARRLTDLGATVVEAPAIEIGPPEDPAPMAEALRDLARYDWVVFTSANAVAAMKEGLEPRALPPGLKVACVGRATSHAMHEAFPGHRVALEPAEDYRGEGLVESFRRLAEAPGRVLLPASDLSRPSLEEGLRAIGASVDRVVAYRTTTPSDLGARLHEALASGIDLVLFASPSAVRGFAEALGARAAELPSVAIGPTTAIAAREAGIPLLAIAGPSTADGLVAAAVRALGPAEPLP